MLKLSPRQLAALDHAGHTLAALLTLFILGTLYTIISEPNASSVIHDPAALSLALLVIGGAYKFATTEIQPPLDPRGSVITDVTTVLTDTTGAAVATTTAPVTPVPPAPVVPPTV